MRNTWKYKIMNWLLAGAVALFGAEAHAQTDVAASVDGAFGTTTQAGIPFSGKVAQTPSNSAGALLGVRHVWSRWVGLEAAYTYNRANQTYSYPISAEVPTAPCPSSGCTLAPPVSISANAHAITGAWVVSRKSRRFRSFALAGGGLLLVVPSGGQEYTGFTIYGQYLSNASYTHTATEFLWELGAGLDWKLSAHFGLRLQDREVMYKSPQLVSTQIYTFGTSGLQNAITYTQEPAFGVYYRF